MRRKSKERGPQRQAIRPGAPTPVSQEAF
ncbi:hypothetical protein FQ186_08825 [Pseudomonas sp. ANT_H14]|nr:hypothetical protein FQ182_00915 [Pseudomonas sp. ANT_H4]KAA0952957.1 hypothetical protein FQ186_08825 [Pseudomonas sp. ANT_H14]